MKQINYKNKKDRKVEGLYYVKHIKQPGLKYEEDEKGFSVLMNPRHQIMKPALDYALFLYESKNSKKTIEFNIKAISHYYNFMNLYGLTGEEELSIRNLNLFIEYLSKVPKGLWRIPYYSQIHPSMVSYLPVHPYIDGIENHQSIKDIYNEWYQLKDMRTKYFFNSRNLNLDIDEESWRYNFEYICSVIRKTLDYLEWLSSNLNWNHRYQKISETVVNKILISNDKATHYIWDICSRFTHIVSVGSNVEVLARLGGRIVLARDGQFLGCSLHPELTEDVRVMQYFIEMVKAFNGTSHEKINSHRKS